MRRLDEEIREGSSVSKENTNLLQFEEFDEKEKEEEEESKKEVKQDTLI